MREVSVSNKWVVQTPSDTVDVAEIFGQGPAALYIGGAGNLTVLDVDGRTVLFTAVPVGTILPIRPKRIMATGTVASAIVAIY